MKRKQPKEIPQCEGACERDGDEHRGTARKVRIVDPRTGQDWGTFYYCMTAVVIDKKAGFTITYIRK
jgi:hypothetical protein